ncbi:SDR family NAD(P)-dependent oxidoreductase [Streptomyces sp. SID4923]|nr:SDR family NAD(P)-dependent oxidoreductase [Streptomyces sp. SID4923]
MDGFRLDGQVAVITGGNGGIGKAIAAAFAQAGAAVAVVGRDQERNERTAAEILADGTTALAVWADVTSRADLTSLHDRVTRQLGPVDVLVNNAGIGIHGESLSMSDEDWDRVLATNLSAVWRASPVFGASMVERGTGSIVNIGSMFGMIINRPQWHVPCAVSKAGVHHLTKPLAAE